MTGQPLQMALAARWALPWTKRRPGQQQRTGPGRASRRPTRPRWSRSRSPSCRHRPSDAPVGSLSCLFGRCSFMSLDTRSRAQVPGHDPNRWFLLAVRTSHPVVRSASPNQVDRLPSVPMLGALMTLPRVLRRLVGLVVLAGAMGVLVAGLAVPAIGAVGSVVNRGTRLHLTAQRVQRRAAGPGLAHPRRQREADRQPLRREPHHRLPEENRPDHAEGAGRDRGLEVLRARPDRRPRVQPRAGVQPPGQGRPGRVDPDPAVRQDHHAGERPTGPDDPEAAKKILYDRTVSRKLQELKYAQNVDRTSPRLRSLPATSTW